MILLPSPLMVPPSADHQSLQTSPSASVAWQIIWDSDKVVASFSAVRELMMGGWFGGGGGGGGGGEKRVQALLKSSTAMISKMISLD